MPVCTGFRPPISLAAGSLLALLILPAIEGACPDSRALGLFRHEIAYDRTEESDPFKGASQIHTHVWERGSITAFHVDEAIRTYPPDVRLIYLFSADGTQSGYFTCPAKKDWLECLRASARLEEVNSVVRTCTATVDLRAIPAWEPSPDNPAKREVAEALSREIETKWQGVQEIVIRDFNLQDRQITMYLRLPDGDYLQGCGFRAEREPHCDGWHLFGQAPASTIRNWIFERPYRLK
jgi:hypothetical protein